MSDKLTLADLILVDKFMRGDSRGGLGKFTITEAIVHQATLADLVEVIESEGGEMFEVTMVEIPMEQSRQTYSVQTPIRVPPGRYLVLRLDEEGT